MSLLNSSLRLLLTLSLASMGTAVPWLPIGHAEDALPIDRGDGRSRQTLVALFDRLPSALSDGPAGVNVDGDRMLQIIAAEGIPLEISTDERAGVRHFLEGATLQELSVRRRNRQWRALKVLAVQMTDPGDADVAVSVECGTGDLTERLVFLVTRDGQDQWRIADWRPANSAVGVVVQKGVLLSAVQGHFAPLDDFSRLQDAHAAVALGNDAEAAQLLRSPLAADAPPSIRAARWLLMADVFSRRDKFDLAENCLAEVVKLRADLPIAWRMKATIALNAGAFAEAEQFARQALELSGDEPEAMCVLGAALRSQGETDEAVAVLRRALEAEPSHLMALLELAHTLPKTRVDELKPFFEKLPDRNQALPELARALIAAGDGDAVATLVAAVDHSEQGDPRLQFLLGEAKFNGKDYAAAAQCYARAVAGGLEEDDELLLRRYAAAMVRSGQATAALSLLRGRTSPDDGLMLLVDELLDQRDAQALDQLLASANLCTPAMIDVVRGESALRSEDWSGAASHFKHAIEKFGKDDHRIEAAQKSLVFALSRQATPKAAYDKSPDKEAAFDQLATSLSVAKDEHALAQLVSAHKEAYPDSPNLPYWNCELLWLAKDYRSCSQLLLKHRDLILEDPAKELRYEDRLIRSLTRIGEFTKAMQYAGASSDRDGDPWFEMVVQAASGNVSETERLIDEVLRLGYLPADVYSDIDVATAINLPEFAELKARLPNPSDAEVIQASSKQ
ncbi:tetratricopeptide repeat protein [Lacipirellula limnantheis]|uniref:Cellulose synthase subunit BcsC n=1 Tax=Lacipirellula limnantheis TaxID=2528024 RepID=A0A517TYH3_9BACT|nr:tetratricopeptide repeat protein [Lacipirellula limnantheis]QDT73424.1 cellulose synthase subunit BcsC [Lacipirellula limnantheis]